MKKRLLSPNKVTFRVLSFRTFGGDPIQPITGGVTGGRGQELRGQGADIEVPGLERANPPIPWRDTGHGLPLPRWAPADPRSPQEQAWVLLENGSASGGHQGIWGASLAGPGRCHSPPGSLGGVRCALPQGRRASPPPSLSTEPRKLDPEAPVSSSLWAAEFQAQGPLTGTPQPQHGQSQRAGLPPLQFRATSPTPHPLRTPDPLTLPSRPSCVCST